MPVKMLSFAFSHLFNCAYFAKISLMQTNIRKSQNNILASPVCEIKDNLCHVFKNFFNGILIHVKHNLLISNNLDQIWFWKKIWLLFYQGVPIYFLQNLSLHLMYSFLSQKDNCIICRHLHCKTCHCMPIYIAEPLYPPPWRRLFFIDVCCFVSLSVCLSVSNITEKRLNRFSWNFHGSWDLIKKQMGPFSGCSSTPWTQEFFFDFFGGTHAC